MYADPALLGCYATRCIVDSSAMLGLNQHAQSFVSDRRPSCRFRFFAAVCAFTLLPIVSIGQTTLTRVVAVRAAHMLDVRSGRMVSHAVVVIEGDHIKAVGENLSIPPGAQLVDLGEATLLPGLIDSHTHLLQY